MKIRPSVIASISFGLALAQLSAAQNAPTALAPSEYKVLYAFPGQDAPQGAVPSAGVVTDDHGNVYGTTIGGGQGAFYGPDGVVYKVTPDGTETVLYNFGMYRTDAVAPFAPVVRAPDGTLYGTTDVGGNFGFGTVYKLDTAGNESLLYSFTGGNDGSQPFSGVFLDTSGDLYGTSYLGGTTGNGVVFKVTQSGKEKVLHSFTGTDGKYPWATVVRDPAGNLYGTTLATSSKFGVVYKLGTSGKERILHTFTGGRDGKWPAVGNLIRDEAGNLYGATNNGGTTNLGIVFMVSPTGKLTQLYSFTGKADGNNPIMPLVRDAAGSLYGVTGGGGDPNCLCGTLFKLDKAGKLTVLHTFTSGTDGAFPVGGVARDSLGALYGATQWGGNPNVQCGSFTSGCGAVFKLVP